MRKFEWILTLQLALVMLAFVTSALCPGQVMGLHNILGVGHMDWHLVTVTSNTILQENS